MAENRKLPMNLTGMKFGKLKVVQKVNKVNKHNKLYFRCECACGKRVTVGRERLLHKQNPKRHCGCESQGLPTKFKKEYHAWWDAVQRCHNPDHPGYARYGSKGISVCPEWRASFERFLEDVGSAPTKGHSIDRIDPHGNYEPSNIRWATDKVQNRNKKGTKWVQHPKTGKPVKAADLAEELGISYQKLRADMIKQDKW